MDIEFLGIFLTILSSCSAQLKQIKIDQGNIVGQKVFLDGSRTAVYSFLGVPYAKPPAENLRFSAPEMHYGWNGTLQAFSMKSVCPQLSDTIYYETADGSTALAESLNEDCLYLNVWVPEQALQYGNLPVLVVITGEDMSFDWSRNRVSGLDIAAEGVIVSTVQYRSNVFGWLNLQNSELSGNYGLKDVQIALNWINQNIGYFGGDHRQITLLGHGSSGGAIALSIAYLATQQSLRNQLISKVILMSSGDIQYILGHNHKARVVETSHVIIQKLGCHFDELRNQIISCLRQKSIYDLLRAYESVYNNGNSTHNLGIVLSSDINEIQLNIKNRAQELPPIIMGITSNEGAFLQHYWLDLAREGYQSLRMYINYTVLPNIMKRWPIVENEAFTKDAINLLYFGNEAVTHEAHLLWGMQRLISEAIYESPFYILLNRLSDNNNTYAYIINYSDAMDMRGKVNIFGGAPHSSDLLFLFGPSLFQQIARRRFTVAEEQLCRELRSVFVQFVKGNHPLSEGWYPYSQQKPFIRLLGEKSTNLAENAALSQNRDKIEKLLKGERETISLVRSNRNEYKSPYMIANVDTRHLKTNKVNNYFENQLDSGYAFHLRRVFGIWQILLPNNLEKYNDLSTFGYHLRLKETIADALRFRQGFFAMLVIVCVLLICLGLCVYLLRRDAVTRGAPSDGEISTTNLALATNTSIHGESVYNHYQNMKREADHLRNDKWFPLKKLQVHNTNSQQQVKYTKVNIRKGTHKTWILYAANSSKMWMLKTGNTS